jgi:hypothetical protein
LIAVGPTVTIALVALRLNTRGVARFHSLLAIAAMHLAAPPSLDETTLHLI